MILYQSFSASLISGHGRGRRLTVPTLNLQVVDGEAPREGVYAIRVTLGNDDCKGVMHVGPRPTFSEQDVSIEVHLLDFSGAMAQDVLKVEILGRLRDVLFFDSVEALKKQIAQDILDAERFW